MKIAPFLEGRCVGDKCSRGRYQKLFLPKCYERKNQSCLADFFSKRKLNKKYYLFQGEHNSYLDVFGTLLEIDWNDKEYVNRGRKMGSR